MSGRGKGRAGQCFPSRELASNMHAGRAVWGKQLGREHSSGILGSEGMTLAGTKRRTDAAVDFRKTFVPKWTEK